MNLNAPGASAAQVDRSLTLRDGKTSGSTQLDLSGVNLQQRLEQVELSTELLSSSEPRGQLLDKRV